jgi:hypothetical protein
MPKMTRTPVGQTVPQPLLDRIKTAIAPYTGAVAALEKAIVDAQAAPTETADVHVDEVEKWKQHGWEIAK